MQEVVQVLLSTGPSSQPYCSLPVLQTLPAQAEPVCFKLAGKRARMWCSTAWPHVACTGTPGAPECREPMQAAVQSMSCCAVGSVACTGCPAVISRRGAGPRCSKLQLLGSASQLQPHRWPSICTPAAGTSAGVLTVSPSTEPQAAADRPATL